MVKMATAQETNVIRSCRRKLSYDPDEVSASDSKKVPKKRKDEGAIVSAQPYDTDSIFNKDLTDKMLHALRESNKITKDQVVKEKTKTSQESTKENIFFMTKCPSPISVIHPVSLSAEKEINTEGVNTIYEDISYNTPSKNTSAYCLITPPEKSSQRTTPARAEQQKKVSSINSRIDQDENRKISTENTPAVTFQVPAEEPNIFVLEKSPEKETPAKKKRTFQYRKRQLKPETWKNNVRKEKRNEGKEYINTKGKLREARRVKDCNCEKCRFHCSKTFGEEERLLIFNQYWGTKSYIRQREFICRFVAEDEVAMRKPKKILKLSPKKNMLPVTEEKKFRRNKTYFYFLPKGSESVRVCKKFFLTTLDIGERTVFESKKKELPATAFVQADRRGKHAGPKKISENALDLIRTHILSFPAVESHYCRQSSKRLYLHSELNVTKMYREYEKKCKTDYKVSPVKKHIYRKIFNSEFNYSFHKPKKDACKHCEKYKNSSEEEKKILEEKHNTHLENKNLARKAKEDDKKRAGKENSLKTFTFDLQAVLYAPCSNISSFFYSRKLSSYNLTIYDQNTKHGECFFWEETEGKRGSDEIGTVLYKHLLSLPEEIKHVIYYSDTCGGQNRNRFVASILLHAVKTIANLQTIELKFLEPGHTQMEADSMHSAIERAKKGMKIFSPLEYPTIIKAARKKQPYEVHKLFHHDIFDLKHLKNQTIQGKLNAVSWLKIKHLKFEKKKPCTIFVKTSHRSDSEFIQMEANAIPLSGKKKKGKRELLVRKYKESLPVSAAKKKDLLTLCKDCVIPKEFHDYYQNLKASEAVKDRLPEPDKDEEEEEEEEEKEEDEDEDSNNYQ